MIDPELRADIQRWLRYAGEDLETAEEMMRSPTRRPRIICWLSQQAAEKAIKAALFYVNIEPPRTHSLNRLCLLLPEGWYLKDHAVDLTQMTEWAVETRYPGEWPEVTEEDAEQAVATARDIFNTILQDLKRHGFPTE